MNLYITRHGQTDGNLQTLGLKNCEVAKYKL